MTSHLLRDGIKERRLQFLNNCVNDRTILHFRLQSSIDNGHYDLTPEESIAVFSALFYRHPNLYDLLMAKFERDFKRKGLISKIL